RAPQESQTSFRSNYVFALYKLGRGVEASGRVEPRAESFRHVADLMVTDKDTKALNALLEAHRPHAAEDGDFLFQEARLKILEKKPDEASALFLKAIQKKTQNSERSFYLGEFVHSLEGLGKGLEAYRAAPDKPQAFTSLARTWLAAKKAGELEQ